MKFNLYVYNNAYIDCEHVELFFAGLGAESDMPDHDLEPPRFSRKALERLLNDWPAVQCMIMSGVSENGTDQLFGDQGQLCRQSGTALLDKFTHSLLVKCSAEVSGAT